MFNFYETFWTVFKSDQTILSSHLQYMSSLVSPHPCQHLVLSLFNFSYSDRCILISHCIFNCIPLIANDVWTSFQMCIFRLYSLFDELSLCDICPFLNWIVWFFGFFYCEFKFFFLFYRYRSFVGHVVCNYFLPVYSLYFHPLCFTQHLTLVHRSCLSLT